MKHLKYCLSLIVLISFTSRAQDILELTESSLKDYLGEKNLNSFNTIIAQEQATVNQKEFKDQYSASAFANATYINTNEEAFIAFQPIISPQNIVEFGVRKKIPYGLDVEASIGFDNRQFDLGSGNENPSIATSSLNINMNLWKNFLGKLDQANLNSFQLQQKRADIQNKINHAQQLYTLRSMFWNLVAVNEQIKISQSMADLAKQQLNNAQSRYRQSAADLAEVSFYRSQLASRNNAVIVYNYNKQVIVDQFKKVIPELSQYSDIQVKDFDSQKTRSDVLQCVNFIQQSVSVPEDQTLYSELIKVVKDFYTTQNKIHKTYDDIDINLNANIYTRAVDPSAFDAFEESFAENRRGLMASLNINVPLGNSKTEVNKTKLNQMMLDNEIKTLRQNFLTQFQFVQKNASLLLQSIEQQKNNLDSLKTRSREILKKFNQGRLSISDYISDQDRLLQTELQLVDSQNLIIQTMLDYLNIFSKSPCAFNQVSV
ncbi:MAG TPA: TolC family protein [Oligoflexia bacterium]|nr:TolC family protein [Oligoflexia bacterium]HMR23962.1 TolC family protein [Oligoflexia bacterium]